MIASFFEKGLFKNGYAFIFVPYPGTDYFERPEKYGIIIDNFDWKKWRRWPDEPVSWLVDFSSNEIMDAYKKASKLLYSYRKLNVFLYKNKLPGVGKVFDRNGTAIHAA